MPSPPSPSPALLDRPAYARTGAKLGTAVLAFVTGVIAVITLQPFAFAWPTRTSVELWTGPFDPVANVALFVPLGFLFALTRAAGRAGAAESPAARDRWLRETTRHAAVLGGALSGVIELVQILEPARYPSPSDLLTNTLGAVLGVRLHGRLAGRLGADSPLVGRLALELPVMGLIYVTLPLCTLAALTVGAPGVPAALDRGGVGIVHAAGVTVRTVALPFLGAFGGLLLGTVWRRQLAPAAIHAGRTAPPAGGALAAALWFALGALPALATRPGAFAAGLAAAGLSAGLVGRGDHAALRIERRFEAEALARATPALVAYLLLLPLGEVALGAGGSSKLDILRRVETLAAFTVGGYLLSEAWGRRELRYRHVAWRVAVVAAAAVLALRGVGALAGTLPASLATSSALVLAAGYGGWLYHLQRAHVRALVAARATAGGSIGGDSEADGMRQAA